MISSNLAADFTTINASGMDSTSLPPARTMPSSFLPAEIQAQLHIWEGVSHAGAVYSIIQKRNLVWNRKLLIFCHGYRPKGIPLVADVDPRDGLYAQLLAEGWVVAMSSYRRQGQIVRDAIEDVNTLRAKAIEVLGGSENDTQVIVEGGSMGGFIATVIAENYPHLYAGCLAIGAALLLKENIQNPPELNYNPQIPIIFLTNTSEMGVMSGYVSKCAKADMPPALWEIEREGHNQANAAERIHAIHSLLGWIRYNSFITMRRHNATKQPALRQSTAEFSSDAVSGRPAAHTTVISVSVWGDFETELTEYDLDRIGVNMTSSRRKFTIETPGTGRRFEGRLGVYPFVGFGIGDWYGNMSPEDRFHLGILSHQFENPSFQAEVQVGSSIVIIGN